MQNYARTNPPAQNVRPFLGSFFGFITIRKRWVASFI